MLQRQVQFHSVLWPATVRLCLSLVRHVRDDTVAKPCLATEAPLTSAFQPDSARSTHCRCICSSVSHAGNNVIAHNVLLLSVPPSPAASIIATDGGVIPVDRDMEMNDNCEDLHVGDGWRRQKQRDDACNGAPPFSPGLQIASDDNATSRFEMQLRGGARFPSRDGCVEEEWHGMPLDRLYSTEWEETEEREHALADTTNNLMKTAESTCDAAPVVVEFDNSLHGEGDVDHGNADEGADRVPEAQEPLLKYVSFCSYADNEGNKCNPQVYAVATPATNRRHVASQKVVASPAPVPPVSRQPKVSKWTARLTRSLGSSHPSHKMDAVVARGTSDNHAPHNLDSRLVAAKSTSRRSMTTIPAPVYYLPPKDDGAGEKNEKEASSVSSDMASGVYTKKGAGNVKFLRRKLGRGAAKLRALVW